MTTNFAKPLTFDCYCLMAVVRELNTFSGSWVQEVRQPNPDSLLLKLRGDNGEGWFLINTSARYARAHFVTRKLANLVPMPGFGQLARSRLDGCKFTHAVQFGLDRIVSLEFEKGETKQSIVAELTGTHANCLILAHDDLIEGIMKPGTSSLQKREIGMKRPYVPLLPNSPQSILDLSPGDDLQGVQGVSPAVKRLIGEQGSTKELLHFIKSKSVSAWTSPDLGITVFSLTGEGWQSRNSISVALEQYYERLQIDDQLTTKRRSLLDQIRQASEARQISLGDMNALLREGGKAATYQLYGELILAYGYQPRSDLEKLPAFDYEGNEVTIKMDSELDVPTNAQVYFRKSKRAKAREPFLREQTQRISRELELLRTLQEKVELTPRIDELDELKVAAEKSRMLRVQVIGSKTGIAERAYEGFRVKEATAPSGHLVLYAENAESNDYLTTRLAKGNDIWLHVRGATSAHVVIKTNNQPTKIQKETLDFAANLAVQNSSSKHSGYVSVDYTLAKYVRKPRGSAKGTATYTNEKTLHVVSD